MQLAHQVEGERGLLEPGDAVAQRRDGVAHLAQVFARNARARRRDLVEQQVGESHLGALDARRAQRLLALERGVEQVRIGQLAGDARELPQGGVGARQREGELLREGEPGRQACRNERGVAVPRRHDPARAGSVELASIHDTAFSAPNARLAHDDLARSGCCGIRTRSARLLPGTSLTGRSAPLLPSPDARRHGDESKPKLLPSTESRTIRVSVLP